MHIKSFSFQDHDLKWTLQATTFDRLTLLVGPSGVGKSTILQALMSLSQVAKGESVEGIAWRISFEIASESYTWEGQFQTRQDPMISLRRLMAENASQQTRHYDLLSETLYKGTVEMARRERDVVFFAGQKTPKLTAHESLISLFAEEDAIKPIQTAFAQMLYSDQSRPKRGMPIFAPEDIADYDSLEQLRSSELDLYHKFFWCYLKDRSVFDRIQARFSEIFPYVEALKFDAHPRLSAPAELKISLLQLKETDVDEWIPHAQWSSGMRRTLEHLMELSLSADGSVILIDEFENSLGVNCIEDITHDILSARRPLQYIITSHHPYIINNVDHRYWKIVTRKGGVVTTHDAASFHLGKSRHEAFVELMNLEPFLTGGMAG